MYIKDMELVRMRQGQGNKSIGDAAIEVMSMAVCIWSNDQYGRPNIIKGNVVCCVIDGNKSESGLKMRTKIIKAVEAINFDDIDFSDDDVIEIVETEKKDVFFRVFPKEYVGNGAVPSQYLYERYDGIFEEAIQEKEN